MIRRANLHWRSINAILTANDKATKMIEMNMEPPVEQDELMDCLLGMLMQDIPESEQGSFIYDVYLTGEGACNADCLMSKYFSEEFKTLE